MWNKPIAGRGLHVTAADSEPSSMRVGESLASNGCHRTLIQTHLSLIGCTSSVHNLLSHRVRRHVKSTNLSQRHNHCSLLQKGAFICIFGMEHGESSGAMLMQCCILGASNLANLMTLPNVTTKDCQWKFQL